MIEISTGLSEALVVDIINRKGSVEHYYHFLLGFLAPLILWITTLGDRAETICVRSCGPMDGLIREVLPHGVRILPKLEHALLLENARATNNSKLRVETIYGFDNRRYYDSTAFRSLKRELEAKLFDSVEHEKRALRDAFPAAGPRIVFIDRGDPTLLYSTGDSEITCAGRDRRSIKNFPECAHFLLSQNLNLLPCTLEGKSLAFQMALFETADIVIAQHGAALTNLLWASDNLDVLEIMPRDRTQKSDHFSALAGHLGQRYHLLTQGESHGPIDCDMLARQLSKIISDKAKPRNSGGLFARIGNLLRSNR
ncbi:glycosyltransferase 61 family protein [Hyphomicrobium facile]|uniref:Glycosyltransferase 61 catalytic domain-containing protein n=1 Tax=Hyphomicrobium facile TaxID=51670 RepID=A0A1I7NTL6_9HYPH|nr:glycosyltransferase family 61 protein [Hyphomicrobium facile]SFV37950.1 Protein of unknown function [Hyphomicrobium facile]